MRVAIVGIGDQDFLGQHFVIVVGSDVAALASADVIGIRCAGYEWRIVGKQVLPEPGAFKLWLKAWDTGTITHPPISGMVVHPAQEPLTDEEIDAGLRQLLVVARSVMAVDAKRLFDLTTIACSTHDGDDVPTVGSLQAAVHDLRELADAVEAVQRVVVERPIFAEHFNRYLGEIATVFKRTRDKALASGDAQGNAPPTDPA